MPVYLLDTNCPENAAVDRDITHRLYGGDQSTRIRQEILLGVGGMRAVRALGLAPGVWHLNEGHAAFLAYVTKQMQAAPVPSWFLAPFTSVLPWLEASLGLLILLGLFTRNALVAGSLVLLLLQIGSSLAQNWSVVGDQLVYAVIFFILLTFSERNRWSLDHLSTTISAQPS